ncbi:MAG: Rpn family recombination-promoting nuclease/putative transposase, partial [Lamprobacter sp.]|uniref:Rpn family recombination-promoting nuclease/putative transposase n=1 Tax=Lamprobacter sp. TaxID=3100796 RepID=UPI002B261C38
MAQDVLRWHLPSERLAFVDLDSLEISKDSDVSKALRASYADLVYRLRPRHPEQGGFSQGAPAVGGLVQDAQAQDSQAQANQQARGSESLVTSAEPEPVSAPTPTPASAPDLALCVYMLFEHKSTPEYWVALQRLRDIALQGEAYR